MNQRFIFSWSFWSYLAFNLGKPIFVTMFFLLAGTFLWAGLKLSCFLKNKTMYLSLSFVYVNNLCLFFSSYVFVIVVFVLKLSFLFYSFFFSIVFLLALDRWGPLPFYCSRIKCIHSLSVLHSDTVGELYSAVLFCVLWGLTYKYVDTSHSWTTFGFVFIFLLNNTHVWYVLGI